MVELYFKFYLLSTRILRIAIGVLVGCALLLKMLILNLHGDEELDAALVFLLVAGDEGGLWCRRVDASTTLWAGRLLGATWGIGLLLGGGGSSVILIGCFWLSTWLLTYFALFVKVCARLNIC